MICKVLDTPGDKCGPAGLMRGSQSTPVVAVKVFVEENQVLPVVIQLHTPGGLLDSTQVIVQNLLASPSPVVGSFL